MLRIMPEDSLDPDIFHIQSAIFKLQLMFQF